MVSEILLNSSPPKSNIYERGWNNFDQGNFILDSLAADWVDITKSEKKNRFLIWLFCEEIQFNALWISSIKKLTKHKLKYSKPSLGLHEAYKNQFQGFDAGTLLGVQTFLL